MMIYQSFLTFNEHDLSECCPGRVQLLYCIYCIELINYPQVRMTTNNRKFLGIEITEEGECDCLGRLRNGQQFFLSNQRNIDIQVRPSHKPKKQIRNPNDLSAGVTNKRSLRKGRDIAWLSPQQKVETNIRQEYYSPRQNISSNDPRDNKMKQYKEIEYKYERPKIQFDFSSSKQRIQIYQKPALNRITSCQNLSTAHQLPGQLSYAPIPANPKPETIEQLSSPRIGFRYNNSQFLPLTPRIKVQGSLPHQKEGKQEVKVQPLSQKNLPSIEYLNLNNVRVNEADQLKTERSIRSVRSQRSQAIQINKNLLLVPKEHQKASSIKYINEPAHSIIQQDTLHSKIQLTNKNKYLQPNRSRIDPKKSGIQGIGRSRIGGKRTKPGRTNLKRINDVDQICSVIDSEEMSKDSDKESVVLGRLREYGSVVEPSGGITTPSTQSKVGYQSTTAQKSLLRAFQSSHFR